jgi:restriction endonuclease S subunit
VSTFEGLEGFPKEWNRCRLSDFVKHKSGDSKVIKGQQASRPRAELFQGFSASGPDVWVGVAQNSGPGIVVSAVGARCGKTFIAEGEWTAIANTHVLLPGAELNNKFLWYLTNREEWWKKSGTAQPFVKVKDSLGRPIALPPLDEQEKIVEILEEQLSRLDAALASVRAVREKSARFRRSLLSAAFAGTLIGHDVSSGILPNNWQISRLDEVAQIQLGRQRSPKHHFGQNMRPYLRAANVKWKGLDVSDVAEMNFTDEEMETYRLIDGDILVNEASGSASEVGKAVVFRGEVKDCGFQNHLIRVRVVNINDSYLYHFLVKNAVSGEYLRESQGVGINHLGKTKLASWPVPIPPMDEQQKIVKILEEQLSRLDVSLARAEVIEAKGAALRRSLLHAAFTGELTKKWREGIHV